MPQPIYLDHNATTPILPEVIEALRACWEKPYLNPASQHELGRAARRVLEDSRDRLAELLGASTTGSTPDRVFFTSGGTESNNLAVRGFLPLPLGAGWGEGALSPTHFIISAIEHPSIATLADRLVETGHKVDRIAVATNGVISMIDLARLIKPEIYFVAAMLANNETGVLQPVAELAELCNKHGIPLHTDASQAAGKLPISFRELGAATMTIAGHKFGGPLGIGALVVRHDVDLHPQLFGGFQQAGMRAGTESVALAVGLRTALELWDANRREWSAHLQTLRDRFEQLICGGDANQILGGVADRLPNTSNIAFLGLDRQALFIALDQAGIACSTGSACASGSSEPSPVHLAMGCEPGVISSALRFSFGVNTTLAEVEEAARRILNVCNSLRR